MVETKNWVSGTTWKAYLHILTSRQPQGVRDIWRGMNLSTPSLAQYHINKLLDMNLIEITHDGKYRINNREQLAILKGFIIMRGKLISRLVIYGGFLLGIMFVYLLFWPFSWNFKDVVILTFVFFSSIVFFLEASNQHRASLDR